MIGLGLALVAAPATSRAQGVAADSFYAGARLVKIRLHLDSVGVEPRNPAADPAALDAALQSYGLTYVRSTRDGTRLYALAGPLTRDDLTALIRSLRLAEPQLVAAAGPLVSFSARTREIGTDQVIVHFHANASDAQIDSLFQVAGVIPLVRTPWEPRQFLVGVQPRPGDPYAATRILNASVLTRWATPNFFGGAEPAAEAESGVPTGRRTTDPLRSAQWHLDGTTMPDGGDIDATDAWSITEGSPSVIIAVIESGGFDTDHEDLHDHLWVNSLGEIGRNMHPCYSPLTVPSLDMPINNLPTVDCSTPNPTPISAGDAHGTAVAGLAGAIGDNGKGGRGVCPQCILMPLRGGSSIYGKVLALLFARDNGAQVVSLSWNLNRDAALDGAINDLLTQGTSVVVAMQNHDENRCVDGDPNVQMLTTIAGVIGVGQSNQLDQRRASSGYGSCIDLLAPGGLDQDPGGIVTTDPTGAVGDNGTNGPTCSSELTDLNYTRCFSGTSAAVPEVAGTIGLMLTMQPSLAPGEVEGILRQTADKIDPSVAAYDVSGFSVTHGYGRLNTFCALRAVVAPAAACHAGSTFEPTVVPVTELGIRFGVSWLVNGGTTTVTGVPGGGPMASPVIELSRTLPNHWMLGLQIGVDHRSDNLGNESRRYVASFQPAYLSGTPGWYLGPSVAVQSELIGTATTTTTAWGVALGYRIQPIPSLAVRLEGRYRHWSGSGPNEWGVALGFGAVWP